MRRIDCVNGSVRARSVWYRQFAEYLQDDLDDVIASFDDVAVGCHSAGCTPTLLMSLERVDEIKVRQRPRCECFHRLFVVPSAALVTHRLPGVAGDGEPGAGER